MAGSVFFCFFFVLLESRMKHIALQKLKITQTNVGVHMLGFWLCAFLPLVWDMCFFPMLVLSSQFLNPKLSGLNLRESRCGR